MKNEQKKDRRLLRRTTLIVLCVVLSVILAVLIIATVYIENLMQMINRVDPVPTDSTLSSSELQQIFDEEKDILDPSFTGPTINPEDVTWAPDIDEPIEQGENIINILLIGQDRRPGEIRARSDAMILCTVNKATKTLTLTSFMRDLYVQIPSCDDNRINVSYAVGGMQLLDKCIEKNFGVTVDGNIEVDFAGFSQVIDLVGGIDIELSKAEANYMNWYCTNDPKLAGEYWSLSEGTNHLSGTQALCYARIRNISNEESADFGRTSRQRIVLTKLVEKAKSMSISELNNLLKQVLPMVTTDLSDSEIFGYVVDLFPLLTDLKINTMRIPADGTYRLTVIKEMSVLLPDLEANRQLLAGIMAE